MATKKQSLPARKPAATKGTVATKPERKPAKATKSREGVASNLVSESINQSRAQVKSTAVNLPRKQQKVADVLTQPETTEKSGAAQPTKKQKTVNKSDSKSTVKKATVAKKEVASKKATTAKAPTPAKKLAEKAAPAPKVIAKKAVADPVKTAVKKTAASSTKEKVVAEPKKVKTDAKSSTASKGSDTPSKKATSTVKAEPTPKSDKVVKSERVAKVEKVAAKAEKVTKSEKTETTKAAMKSEARPEKKSAAKDEPVSVVEHEVVEVPPPAKVAKTPGRKPKEPVRKVIVMPPTTNTPAPAPRPQTSPAARVEEKKPSVIVAQRRTDSKEEKVDTSKTMINYQPEYTRSILDTDPEPAGPVYRYSDEELAEFREIVSTRLEASRKDLAYLQGLLTRKDEAGTEDSDNRYMNMEDGSGAMEREQMAQLASRQIQLINNLEKALMRIENKTYGICRVTGKLIDKARLRAVPHATLSIEAKNTMSKK